MQHDSYVRVRIPLELKERLKLQGTDISEVVRVALEAVVAGVPPTPSKEKPKRVIQKKPEKKVNEGYPPCGMPHLHPLHCLCGKSGLR